MSQQAPDLPRSVQIIRRHGTLVGILAGLGLLIGAVFAALNPPMLTSTALVVLPQSAQSEVHAPGVPDPYMATQEVIAGSNPVLSGALPDVRPAMSLDELRREVQVGSPTSDIISVSAKGKVAAYAEATANAVARSYIAYVRSQSSPVGPVPAQLLEPARSATGTAPPKRLLIDVLLGAIFGALVGVIAALSSSRTTLDPATAP